MALTREYPLSDYLSVARASAAWSFGADGALVEALPNTLRHDYDPGTLAYRGVLAEKAGANLLPNCRTPFRTGWSGTGIAATTPIVGPTGVADDATRVSEGGENSPHFMSGGGTITPAGSTVHTWHVLGRANSGRYLQIVVPSAHAGVNVWANFDLLAGAVGSVGSSASARISRFAGNWWRCEVTGTTVASPTSGAACVLGMASSLSMARVAEYAGKNVEIDTAWATLEASLFASSPILPPVGTPGASTRNPDDIAASSIGRWYSADTGTLVVEFMPGQAVADGPRGIVSLDDGTGSNRVELYMLGASPGVRLLTVSGGVTQVSNLVVGDATVLVRNTLRLSWGPAGWFVSLNGAAPATTSLGTLPTSLARMRLGNRGGVLTDYLQGWIAPRVAHYPVQYTDTAAADGFTIRNR